MSVQTIRENKSDSYRMTVTLHLWVRESMCAKQPQLPKVLQKQQSLALSTTLIRLYIATNHL